MIFVPKALARFASVQDSLDILFGRAGVDQVAARVEGPHFEPVSGQCCGQGVHLLRGVERRFQPVDPAGGQFRHFLLQGNVRPLLVAAAHRADGPLVDGHVWAIRSLRV